MASSPTSSETAKRTSLACFNCRLKRQKCDGNKSGCSQCAGQRVFCTFPDAKKRGPVKGYIDSLESRIYQLETTLLQLLPFVSDEQLSEITASIPPTPNRHYFRARFNAIKDGTLPYDLVSSPVLPVLDPSQHQHTPILPQAVVDKGPCCNCLHQGQWEQTRPQDPTVSSLSWPQFAVPNRPRPLTTYSSTGSSELDFMPELEKNITQQRQQDLVQEILLSRYDLNGTTPPSPSNMQG
ncbi:hypothetical protein PV04_03367 [Phialophora macrospora]|uniref:Zn(2)-C6 fungal-type domain-containing protein n=1 Tax=Phialophora macrospora TaxID=1851006 RepID=A0A0D2EA31_9EURO|nr:hypothetical protein PV04_03367 [Phialophora macrospora]